MNSIEIAVATAIGGELAKCVYQAIASKQDKTAWLGCG